MSRFWELALCFLLGFIVVASVKGCQAPPKPIDVRPIQDLLNN